MSRRCPRARAIRVTRISGRARLLPSRVSRSALARRRFVFPRIRLGKSLALPVLKAPHVLLLGLCLVFALADHVAAQVANNRPANGITLNQTDDGYRGIWYMNQPSGDEYVYKYSGGLGTYCAKHNPFAVYRPEVDRTFFCYGGTTHDSYRRLVHMVSYFDHKTKTVPRPTILLDKGTSDAHDNPVIAVDDDGYLWIFSTSHGTARPSYIHRSKSPYDTSAFELVKATRADGDRRVAIDNFSYMQAWHVADRGFLCFFTSYGNPAKRTIMCMSSRDGVEWSEWTRLAAIDEGHYQTSAVGRARAGSAFNFHPAGKGLNWRTNLYYVETPDFGTTWQTVDGQPLDLPLTNIKSAALIHDYQSEGLNVYLKDITYDADDRPVLLYITSGGYESGPKNDPRTWTTARWTGETWDLHEAFTSDHNYDFGSLWIGDDGVWRIIAPTETGPQAYNPGGEVVLWTSHDLGKNWTQEKQLTAGSERNHTYVRRPVDAHPDFYALWADGNAREPSPSRLYLADREGNVFGLPVAMTEPRESLERIAPPSAPVPSRAERNEAMRAAGIVRHADLRYDTLPGVDAARQSLDIYTRPGLEKAPVVLFVHGGGWHRGDKGAVMFKPLVFAPAGFVTVSTNYRFRPDVTVADMARDVATAAGWVHKNIADYGGDPNRIYLMGHSAGAHLVAVVGTNEQFLKGAGLSFQQIAGVVPLDGGPYNVLKQLAASAADPESDFAKLAAFIFTDDKRSWRQVSPMQHITAGVPPFLVVSSEASAESQAQAIEFVNALSAADIEAEWYKADGLNHTGVNLEIGKSDHPITRRVMEFLGR